MSSLLECLEDLIRIDWDYHTQGSPFQVKYMSKNITLMRALNHFSPGFTRDDLVLWSRDQADRMLSDKIERFLYGATFKEIEALALNWEQIQKDRALAEQQAEKRSKDPQNQTMIQWLQSL